MNNNELRQYAAENGVKLWQIAERVGLNDGNFSRKLRKELPPDERDKLMHLVDEIAAEREGE